MAAVAPARGHKNQNEETLDAHVPATRSNRGSIATAIRCAVIRLLFAPDTMWGAQKKSPAIAGLEVLAKQVVD